LPRPIALKLLPSPTNSFLASALSHWSSNARSEPLSSAMDAYAVDVVPM